jgi:hypothetical protein
MLPNYDKTAACTHKLGSLALACQLRISGPIGPDRTKSLPWRNDYQTVTKSSAFSSQKPSSSDNEFVFCYDVSEVPIEDGQCQLI